MLSVSLTPKASLFQGGWTELEGELWFSTGAIGREGHSGVGDDRPPVTGSFIYNPKTKAWREGPALRTPRVETASFTANGRIYQFGGSTKSLGGETIDRVESIGPRESEWRDEGNPQDYHE